MRDETFSIGSAQPTVITTMFDGEDNELADGEVAAQCAAIGDAASYGALVNAHGPVSYWRMDELSGSKGVDARGANDGSYLGTLQFVQPGAP